MTDPTTPYADDDLRGRLMAVLIQVEGELSARTRDFVTEELDHNELGLALDAMVEELAERRSPVDRAVVADLQELARRMEMAVDVVRMLPPVGEVDAATRPATGTLRSDSGRWIEPPAPPLVEARSEPYLVRSDTVANLLAYASSRDARTAEVDVAGAGATGQVIDALKRSLPFPDWCGSGWDSVEDAFEELRATWGCPLLLVVRGVDHLLGSRPQLALATVVRLAELARSFSVAGDQLIVALVWDR